ncbi:hypothetical protein AVEN_259371-1 [Araneus ventricosus]|uniref:Uncharacterized protein n=1 Tax=Araneus ventricosus TaxID=182803 RepID=A0A4Y2DRL9_ARAVE|nr:hypothetical protein AVEN_259371-1 [Araneus ventricosus]
MSPLFPRLVVQTTPVEVPEGTTQDERKWVINLTTLRKPARAQWRAVALAFSGKTTCLSRQRPPFKIEHEGRHTTAVG